MINKKKRHNFYYIVKTLIKLVDVIVPLVTLGYYWTDLEYKYVKWHMFKFK